MGGFTAQVQQPQTSGGGKTSLTGQAPQPMDPGGNYQISATSGQPRIGQPNQYPNTVGQWDNTQQQPQMPMQGKGKGA